MTAIYITVPILILIVFLIVKRNKKKKIEYAEWLIEITQWEIGDIVEIHEFAEKPYYCVERNEKVTSTSYYNYAKECYLKRYPNQHVNAFVELVKWNETDCIIRGFGTTNVYHMSTKFINKNISYIKRKLDKGMDTFVLSKKDKIQQLRNKKLIRILNQE
jgi:uncharacterized membrane protein YhdT